MIQCSSSKVLQMTSDFIPQQFILFAGFFFSQSDMCLWKFLDISSIKAPNSEWAVPILLELSEYEQTKVIPSQFNQCAKAVDAG